ncbi:MAG: transcription-repair coupling factor, partial [Acidimicrobiales bacterium]
MSAPPLVNPLRALLPLVAEDPGLVSVAGTTDAVLAVPEVARAVTVAAVAETAERRPLLVVVPTTPEAERLEADLAALLGRDRVEGFPAWETLPFERVSPSIDTSGQRLEVLWRLGDPATMPWVIVSPVRSLLQRISPTAIEAEALVVGVGDEIDQQQLIEQLVSMGYRREYQVEHRGEVAVRGSIVDVYPSTADAPVRIDLWGDEVDRLTEFAVADQ